MRGPTPPGEESPRPQPRPQPQPPQPIRQAALVAAVEGLAVLAAAIVLAVDTVLSKPDSYGRAVFGAVLAAVTGVLLLRLARGILRLEGWSRAPLIVLQLLFIPVGYSLAFQSGLPWYGVPILALCAVGIVLLLMPAARVAFLDR